MAKKIAHRLVVQSSRTTATGWTAVTFGCTCGRYGGDETVGEDLAEAEERAGRHVATHARIAGGALLPI